MKNAHSDSKPIIDRFNRSVDVLIGNLNHHCNGNQIHAFRYVSNFCERMKKKYAELCYEDKLNVPIKKKTMIEKKQVADIYQLLAYFLVERNMLGKERDYLPAYQKDCFSACTIVRGIEPALEKECNMRINDVEFS